MVFLGGMTFLVGGIFLLFLFGRGVKDKPLPQKPSPIEVVVQPPPPSLPPLDPRLKEVQPAVDRGVALLKENVKDLTEGKSQS